MRSATARDYLVELGGGRLVPEFDAAACTGMSAGETVTFPVDLRRRPTSGAELRGQARWTTRSPSRPCRRRSCPSWTTTWPSASASSTRSTSCAPTSSGASTRPRQSQVDELFRRMVIDAVTEKATVEVPAGDGRPPRRHDPPADRPAAARGRLLRGLRGRDRPHASTQIVEELRPDAEMAVRRELVVEAVADAEGIEVSDEEMEEQVRTDAEATGRAPDRLAARAARARRLGRPAPGHAHPEGRRCSLIVEAAGPSRWRRPRPARSSGPPRTPAEGRRHETAEHGREAGPRGEALDARRPPMTRTTRTEPTA